MSAIVHNENFRRDSLFIQANTERTLLYPFARVRLSEHIGTRLSKMHEQRSKMRNNCKNLNSLIQMQKTGTQFKYYSDREFLIRNNSC